MASSETIKLIDVRRHRRKGALRGHIKPAENLYPLQTFSTRARSRESRLTHLVSGT